MADRNYTLKEQIAYHKKCANSGKGKDGKTLSMADRVRHGIKAERKTRKLNRFMKTINIVK